MQPIGNAAGKAVALVRQELDKPKSQAVALPPRETSLTVPDFAKLEDLIARDCQVKAITKSGSKPKKDPDGFIYGWTFELEEVGLEILPVADLDQRLVEAIQRPATSQGAIYHFTRLAATKRNTRGNTGFQVALEDLAYDLRGKSEWAIMKACEFFRKDPSPFFPDHSAILEKVELFDRASKTLKIEGPKSDG